MRRQGLRYVTGCPPLLPVSCLVRRVDVVGVIGAGLAYAASGWGHRRIAQQLGRPAGTVRGWMRQAGVAGSQCCSCALGGYGVEH